MHIASINIVDTIQRPPRPGKNSRPWVIPIVGGLLFFVLVYVWLASALWFFDTTGRTF